MSLVGGTYLSCRTTSQVGSSQVGPLAGGSCGLGGSESAIPAPPKVSASDAVRRHLRRLRRAGRSPRRQGTEPSHPSQALGRGAGDARGRLRRTIPARRRRGPPRYPQPRLKARSQGCAALKIGIQGGASPRNLLASFKGHRMSHSNSCYNIPFFSDLRDLCN